MPDLQIFTLDIVKIGAVFTDPLRFARPPGSGGQIVKLLFPPLS